MIRLFLIASSLLAIASCSPSAPPASAAAKDAPAADAPLKLACGPDDFIKPGYTKASLIAAFGADNVTEEQVAWVDSEETAVVLFPADPSRRAEFIWIGETNGPRVIRVGGPGSKWIGPKGLKIGASAEEVEKANGGPFELMGFSNHNAGELTDLLGGKLDEDAAAGCSIDLTFDTPDDLPPDVVEKVNDDPEKTYRSDSPEMRAAKARVFEFVVTYVK